MRTDSRDVIHLPWARLVTITAAGECAHGADIDAHAALLAVQLVASIGSNHRTDAKILHTQRPHVHAFATHANAAVAENAAGAVKVHSRRPLLFFAMLLGLGVEAFARAVFEGHVLEFALAAGITHRTIERVVAEYKLDGSLASLSYLRGFGDEDLALCDSGGTGRLQFTTLSWPTTDMPAAACRLGRMEGETSE